MVWKHTYLYNERLETVTASAAPPSHDSGLATWLNKKKISEKSELTPLTHHFIRLRDASHDFQLARQVKN